MCTLPVFIDIAITPNSKLWGISDKIYEVDINNCTIIRSFEPIDEFGIIHLGNGLVALNNETLITNSNDSLYKIDLTTGLSHYIGTIGYYCAGDFEFLNGNLYMSTSSNQIIKIGLSQDFSSIVNIELIAVLEPGYSIYGLFNFSSSQTEELGLSRFHELYKLNLITKEIELVCELEGAEIFGTATMPLDNANPLETINVLTPNNDGVNDCIFISNNTGIVAFEVFNRWGNQLFQSNEFPLYWNGLDNSGNVLMDGVYFMKCTYKSCNSSKNEQVNEISIIK